MSNDKISSFLGLPPMVIENDEEELVITQNKLPATISEKEREEEAERDYDFARGNMQTLIAQGSESLEELIAVAVASQNPRAYEVVSNTLKILIEANEKLVGLSGNKVKDNNVRRDGAGFKEPGSTTNNLFVGTTQDLMKAVEAIRKK